MAASKTIWVVVKRFDEDDDIDSNAVSMNINDNEDTETVRLALKKAFCISDPDLILKLRNTRGSLIPINSRIEANTSEVPYVLEVVRLYQNVMPCERSVQLSSYSDAVKTKLSEITIRLQALETATPELNNRRSEKIKAEMGELDQKIEFLKKRINDADSAHWRGMFKKNPMW
ncbi:uncharacterized protein LOC124126445 [Haliotis rufescens]|uniref:uncharacterized protein LOC124126445 n=1 Tax=Haliotis rufescens TaxID=6454 RepID=UPI00201F1DFA|nr:uncharacterized protein LOC124126445 [Haliotis rufescens]